MSCEITQALDVFKKNTSLIDEIVQNQQIIKNSINNILTSLDKLDRKFDCWGKHRGFNDVKL